METRTRFQALLRRDGLARDLARDLGLTPGAVRHWRSDRHCPLAHRFEAIRQALADRGIEIGWDDVYAGYGERISSLHPQRSSYAPSPQ